MCETDPEMNEDSEVIDLVVSGEGAVVELELESETGLTLLLALVLVA